jgi:carboxymethylenebutenolidase
MCDEHTVEETEAALRAGGGVSRRGFAALTGAAAVTVALAPPANAQAISETDVKVTTPDGVADCFFAAPSAGKHPAVIVWPDILGLRPAFRQMGRRLAQSGYAVLTVNPYYRTAVSPVIPDGASFQDPAIRSKVMPLAQTLNAQTHATDAKAFVGWLDQQPQVDVKRRIGTTGYCMGGPIVMRSAAAVPDRIGAGASFHGGGLTTKAPDSPHLLIPQMKASFLIAIADNDDQRDPESKDTLRAAFAAAGLKAEIEVYAGAAHGWCPPDMPVYNEAAAEKAWGRLLALFETALV